MRSGGGFGRRYFYDFIAEAAYLAIQTKKTVKLLWTREDCIQHSRYHLARYDKNTLVLDKNNNILAWDTVITSGDNGRIIFYIIAAVTSSNYASYHHKLFLYKVLSCCYIFPPYYYCCKEFVSDVCRQNHSSF